MTGLKRGEWVSACESAHCVKVRKNGDGTVNVGQSDEYYVTFTWTEWKAFTDGVMEGEFDL